ncbi:response regulator [Nisaea acidiphila]|uniref:Response regulator n=1 Tax=Nisaea acidiphila TaxID=1862145 RepID=A0A9J7ANT1_9PROT|nr:response regulator [Nisaea acidiphila]UUX48863.1 response regulator [Nisaea acidiphila]
MTLKILVVDDEPDFAAFVADAVEELGHAPELATTPKEFASAYSNETDVIFLDLFMPDMDGIEVLRFLSENGSRSSVVLMSGGDEALLKAGREIAQERGISVLGVLHKPIQLDSISDVLANKAP